MALTFCSAPATTVGGERSFSEGCNQCGRNQESMSSQIFREQMSVGSWCEAPFFNMDTAEQIIVNHTHTLHGSSSN
ncbi:hypothetical protein DFH07DRAFT_733658 [Mycena maculata]|uniref:Uncharacterized protein n=1 Tax=Mycena maculata TaxID=230809 RepID=A0AAD7JVD8_9AGAR|nr:hypothetical protein DFH07DRAFT_733658 [Mycena maculata]